MKVGVITNAANRVTIESDVAKVGFKFKYALAAAFTTALAQSKWNAHLATIDITAYLPAGPQQLAYKAPFTVLAEIGAFDESSVEVVQSSTANFAEAFGAIEITTGGVLPLNGNQLVIEVNGLAAGEEIEIFSIDMPVTAEGLLKYEIEECQPSVPKNLFLGNAVAIALPASVTKIDCNMMGGVRNIYETSEIRILSNEINESSVNFAGVVAMSNLVRVIPANIMQSVTVYAQDKSYPVIVRNI